MILNTTNDPASAQKLLSMTASMYSSTSMSASFFVDRLVLEMTRSISLPNSSFEMGGSTDRRSSFTYPWDYDGELSHFGIRTTSSSCLDKMQLSPLELQS